MMIDNETRKEVERVLGMWLQQYAIERDADREARPEIRATRALLARLENDSDEVRYQIQISTTDGISWSNSPLAAFSELDDARAEMATAPVTTWMRCAVQPVIYRDGVPLRYGNAIIDGMIERAKELGGEAHWASGKELELRIGPRAGRIRLCLAMVEWLEGSGFVLFSHPQLAEYYHPEHRIFVDLQNHDHITVTLGFQAEENEE